MPTTIILGALIATLILVRQIRWLAVIALLVAIGYVANGYLDYWPREDRRDHMVIVRP